MTTPLYDSLFELAVSAVEHSGRGGGYLAPQTDPNRDLVSFAIADCESAFGTR